MHSRFLGAGPALKCSPVQPDPSEMGRMIIATNCNKTTGCIAGAEDGKGGGAVKIASAPRNLASAAASFAASMVKFAASGFKTVDQPLHQLRMSHCQTCEYRKETQCQLCRCFIDKKAWLPHEDCPIGRWPT